jgi:hypothetical protein
VERAAGDEWEKAMSDFIAIHVMLASLGFMTFVATWLIKMVH